MRIGYFFRPECGCEDRFGPEIGPFPEWLQITYCELRVGPDGGSVAWYRPSNGWVVFEPFGKEGEVWTDIVIWARPLVDGEEFIKVKG